MKAVRWAHRHRLLVSLLLLLGWVLFCTLAVVAPETATAVAVGAIPLTLAVACILRIRLPDIKG